MRVAYMGTMGNVMFGELTRTEARTNRADGTTSTVHIVETGDGWHVEVRPENYYGEVTPAMEAAKAAHPLHRVVFEVADMASFEDEENEDILWCEKCETTIYYFGSDVIAE